MAKSVALARTSATFITELIDNLNLDLLQATGEYIVHNPTNSPGTADYIVEVQGGNVNSQAVTRQVATNISTGTEYVRVCLGGTWTSWTQRNVVSAGSSTFSTLDVDTPNEGAAVTSPSAEDGSTGNVPVRFTGVLAGDESLPGWVNAIHTRREVLGPMMGLTHVFGAIPQPRDAGYSLFGLISGDISNSGSAPGVSPANTNVATALPGVAHASSNSTDVSAGWYMQAGKEFLMVSDGSLTGGFTVSMTFGCTSTPSGSRAFMGLGVGGRYPDGAEPTAAANSVGVGWATADAQVMQFIHNDGSGTATKVAISAVDFPWVSGEAYELIIINPRKSAATFHVSLRRLSTNKVVSATFSTDVPVAGTLLSPQCNVNSSSTSQAMAIRSMGFVAHVPMPGVSM